jgi:hypothetical protein
VTTASGEPGPRQAVCACLTSGGALADHATAPIGDIVLNTGPNNTVADVTIASDASIVVALEGFPRAATRYEKLARNFLAGVMAAAALVWWI